MSITLEGLDRRRFPSVASYLDHIPGGLSAYPACQGKASLLRSVMDDFPVVRLVAGLPAALAELVLHPPPSGHWIQEVHFRAIMRAVLDEFFKDAASFVAWTYGAQQRLLGGPLYRVMFALMTPERIIKTAQSRWSAFHRGSALDIEASAREGVAVLSYPPHSYGAVDHDATLAGFRVALELAGARQVELTEREVGPTRARCRIRWR